MTIKNQPIFKKQEALFIKIWKLRMERKQGTYFKFLVFLALSSLVLSIFATFAQPAQAQDQIGTIRGTVFRDVNENGLCSAESEAVLADIPLEIINDDTGEFIRYTTAPDGTYAHTTPDLGIWRVTVVPGSQWRVTSQQTIEVTLTPDSPDAAGIDFCIVEIETNQENPVTLPESGAFIAPPLLVAGLFGLALIILGGALLLGRRLI